jgi:flavin reductase (DIM6/NTAB) family NADH-FMN oxidoreductase RutF
MDEQLIVPGPQREHEAVRGPLKEAMARLASGVVLVTNWVEGRPWGVTVSSCTSLSMHPPLILVCIAEGAVSARAIMEQQSFGVGILTAEQIEIANRGAAPGQPKFIDELVSEESAMGSPAIRRALANIHCELYNAVNVGDHVVFIGEVREVGLGAERAPLVYFDRELCGLGSGPEKRRGGIDGR